METPACCPESRSPIQICNSTVVKQDTPVEQIGGSRLESADDAEQHQKIGSPPKKLEIHKGPGPSEDSPSGVDGATESGLTANTDTKSLDPCWKASSFGDVNAVVSAGKSGFSDFSAANDHKSTLEGVREIDRVEDHISDKSEDHPAEFSGSGRDPKVVLNRSETDLDYDNFDAIEVARLVAIEVKREVDCRENSGSSSDRVPGGDFQQPDSPDSACGPQMHDQVDSPGEMPTASDLSAEASPLLEEEKATSSGSLDAEPTNEAPKLECSQVTDVAQKFPADPERGLCDFDLNQEVCTDDVDRAENLSSMPISIVSASRAAAAPGMPVAPLQFEGVLGWKGSAATSAFRPASPRRIPEADRAHSTGGSNSSSKQRDGCLDIDLNLGDSLDEKVTEQFLQKQIPESSGLPSGESSVEASPRIERIELDLNRVSDDGITPFDWRTSGLVLHQRNGYHSQSPSSSSSSKQPSLRNIDLNLSDQPSFVNDSSDHPFLSKLSQSLNMPGAKKSDDSVISIMGMRVEVNRKDPHSLPSVNGRSLEPATDANFGRTGGFLGSTVPYTHSPIYGYNGPAMAFSSPMYGAGGPIPYMLDSRGTPVVPQVMGSAPGLPPVFPHPPILMGMAGTTLALNGAGPSRNSFDLNSGMIPEGETRDTGGLRQFLNPGPQSRLMDRDPFNSMNSQASTSSGAGVKRKEPDSMWEPYPNIKHNPPPWR